MYLSKLEIFGFKSFAQKTVINFNRGVTAIVGPNGCGKTNIVDALRWSLGEQKSSALRSDKMENVIFNGSNDKKPMGMAEVSLTMINDKGKLPTEYSEVQITRRIFRSGESEYLMNKNVCRLKDIINLFMDTGMGANAYSVIELKMVETILSNKTEERRHLFEEAAGVNKYKIRRRLSLKKLDEVNRDLTRVNDIVSEVEKKVASLERQAKRFDKYNQLFQELSKSEVELSEKEFSYEHKLKSELQSEKNVMFQDKIAVDSEIRKLDEELIKYRENISSIELKLREKRIEISEQTEKIHGVQQKITIAEERKKALEKNIANYKSELEEYSAQKEENLVFMEGGKSKRSEYGGSIEKLSSEIIASEERLEAEKADLEEKRRNVKELSEKLFVKFKEISNKENQLENYKKSLDESNANVERLNKKILDLTNNLAKTVGYLEELELEKTQAEEKLSLSEVFFARKQTEKNELERTLSALKEKELEEKTALSALKDKIDFLQSLISNLEGISKGSKILIESEGWTEKEKTILADVGSSKEDFKFALEAALKPVLNNLLIDNIKDLNQAISYLKKNDLGKASFYVLGIDSARTKSILDMANGFRLKKKMRRIVKDRSFLGWAESFIETEKKWKPFFSKLLNRTAVVKDLDSALRLSKMFPDFNFAALNGDYVHQNGIIDAGSAPRSDDSLLGRRKQIEKSKNEFPVLQAKIESLREEIAGVEKQIESIDLKDLSDQGKLLLNDLANIEKQAAQFEFEKKRISEEIDKSRNEIQEYVNRIGVIESQIDEFSQTLQKEIDEKNLAAEDLSLLEAKAKESEENYDKLLGEHNSLKLSLERAFGERKNAEAAVERAEASRVNLEKAIEKRLSDIFNAEEEIALLDKSIEIERKEFEDLDFVRKRLIGEEENIDGELSEVKSFASKLEDSLHELRKKREEISDKLHTIDIKINEINLKLENLQNYIKENYSTQLEVKEFEDLDSFNFTEAKETVQNLKIQIRNLGPINAGVYQEYEEEKQRLEFLLKQRDDLTDSEKDLLKTIEDINSTAQTLFLETFEKIKDNFIGIFRTLFNPGDEADLKLEENADPLEAKIEIIAKPKGKRPTSIELLSGGEKTLTAIALLFAIYLVKPSPFCILDEVDAPLDDANVDRFTKIIHDFSKDTQFIIVTHNKRTMESAETLYGVTMQEEGVSKIVSVRFNEELNAAS